MGLRGAGGGVVEEGVEALACLLLAAEHGEEAGRVEGDHPEVLRGAALDESFGGGRVELGPGAVGVAVLDVAAFGRGVRVEDVLPVLGAFEEEAVGRVGSHAAGKVGGGEGGWVAL